MKYRLDYFAKHLGIDFKKERQWLIEISDIRNKIAHGKPLEAITKDDTTIPLPDIQNTVGRTIHDAMHAAFNMGKSKHPAYFLLK